MASTIRLLDYIVSAARQSSRPTLIVRTSNEGATFRVDDELSLLPEEARDALKYEDIAIIEFKADAELEALYDRLQVALEDRDGSCLHVQLDFVPSAGRLKAWSTPRG